MNNISSYPAVYKISFEQDAFEELQQKYSKDILCTISNSEVESAMVEYITKVIEPVGWMAVWRATPKSFGLNFFCDMLVEVNDVSMQKLEADVKVLKIFSEDKFDEKPDFKSKVETVLKEEQSVPLMELYPVSEGDEEEQFLNTALAIEHVRPWDEDEENDIFVEKYLTQRLRFYFDVKSKIVPEAVATKAAAILKEAWEVKEKLENLHCEMNVSDSETELTEEDVLRSMELRMKLDEFQKELEILENPLVRCLVMKKDLPYLSPEKNQRNSLDPVTRIVASCFSLSLIKDLPLEPESEVEFYHQLGPAVAASCAGDTILILPGLYQCDGLCWLDHNLIIKGVKSEQEVVLQDVGNGDIFINCNAESLVLENLTIQPSEGIICAVMVHSGKTEMKNCTVKGKAAQSCLIVLSTAQMNLMTCTLVEAKSHGIQLRAGGKLTIDSSSITHCNRSGLQIELLPSCSTEVTILNTTIEYNKDFAICLDEQGNNQAKDSEKEVDLDFLYKCSLLKVKIQGYL
ncbi:SHC binding and spindle associated nessun dorma isoform X2 [Tachypleus tridentatus]|uniref:SHC binding and spindle associated nessun dorma isoform X2 n=1 Tax=Tachypleus tridentatus TaxID=6853 RepID=UPI003FD388EE